MEVLETLPNAVPSLGLGEFPEEFDEDDIEYWEFEVEERCLTSLPTNFLVFVVCSQNLIWTLAAFVFHVASKKVAAWVSVASAIIYSIYTLACIVTFGPDHFFRLPYAVSEVIVALLKIAGSTLLVFFVVTEEGKQCVRGSSFFYFLFVVSLVLPRAGIVVRCWAVAVSIARRKVSQQRRRFCEDGFDLDLTYITKQIIAMSYPSKDLEAKYRNPMDAVRRFLHTRHPKAHCVYNLCAEPERRYDPAVFHHTSQRIHFFDHNVCPLAQIVELVEDMHSFLAASSSHVCAIHCKAGKGRTGMVVACLLMREGVRATASEALQFYAKERTHDRKGVTIPSQMRYAGLYETYLREGRLRVQLVWLRKVSLQNLLCNTWFHAKDLRVRVRDADLAVVMQSGFICGPTDDPAGCEDPEAGHLTPSSSNSEEEGTDSSDAESCGESQFTRIISRGGSEHIVFVLPSSTKPLPDDFRVDLCVTDKRLCVKREKTLLSFWLNSGYIDQQFLVLSPSELDLGGSLRKSYQLKVPKDVKVVCAFELSRPG